MRCQTWVCIQQETAWSQLPELELSVEIAEVYALDYLFDNLDPQLKWK